MQTSAAVVIVAAGSSKRMAGRDKLWHSLAGRPTLAHTIDAFEASPLIERIVLVVNATRLDDARHLCERESWRKVAVNVAGGARRQDSVRLGLEALAAIAPETQWVMIHDGARPFVSAEIIQAGLLAAQEHGAAIAAVPVKDTIKRVAEGRIQGTLDRTQLQAVQTPQVFAFPLLLKAHRTLAAAEEELTDDAALLERLGHTVAVFPGSYSNIKITTQEDLLLAEFFLQGQATS